MEACLKILESKLDELEIHGRFVIYNSIKLANESYSQEIVIVISAYVAGEQIKQIAH